MLDLNLWGGFGKLARRFRTWTVLYLQPLIRISFEIAIMRFGVDDYKARGSPFQSIIYQIKGSGGFGKKHNVPLLLHFWLAYHPKTLNYH